MDEINKKIIRELENNSRQTNIQLAKKLKVSEGTIRQRITKLSKNKIINFTIETSTLYGFSAMVLIKTDPSINTDIIAKKLKNIESVKNIFETTGNFDIIIKLNTDSALEFNGIIEKIRTINGIDSTESLVILKKS